MKAIIDEGNGGGEIIREAAPMNAGKTIIAFLKDPDGYEVELIGGRE